MRLEHHLVGGYVRYISPYIIIIYLPIHTWDILVQLCNERTARLEQSCTMTTDVVNQAYVKTVTGNK